MTASPMLPFDDRGFAYGDGVFETVLLRDGEPILWDYHRARLRRGCEVLGIPMPSDAALEATWHTADPGERLPQQEVLKIVLTRGSGGRGYAPPLTPFPRLLSHRMPFTPNFSRWSEGIHVCICDLRLAQQPRLAGIKHLNRLENVLARREWQREDIAEGLLADQQNNVVEATSMNVFWQQDGAFWTPPLTQCGVAGTLREALLSHKLIAVAPLPLSELCRIERLWVGNSVQGIWPVVALVTHDGQVQKRWTRPTSDVLQAAGHRLLGFAA
ncbi:aminodeoxychorismate lyase [Halomonas vilamensis]|uniref:Aminodeoxychorismate lyase n=1 Tax=Vreelandella vilamensis TaxID=531309 RepID=A0ABU1H136_9GAMM|nr:aminodeoxychorismate lyase [Halomonas vilamensis]MDR5898027.1 aminodeoxychorismate lyase [Halomonas vilamensis]